MQTSKTIARDALVVGAGTAGLLALLSPGDLACAGLSPHPIWLAVLLIASYHGQRGLAFALPATWGPVALGALLLDRHPGALLARSASGADLGALIACVMVAWVSSARERAGNAIADEKTALARRLADAEATVIALHEATTMLHRRTDRIDTTLAFQRDIAARLEGPDPEGAAQAALELAMTRISARYGAVLVLQGDLLATAAVRGSWSADATCPPALYRDNTAYAALARRATVTALHVREVTEHDSDMAAPIIDADGNCRGVLTLRGVPLDALRGPALHDLSIIACWCERRITSPLVPHPGIAAVAE